jgi:NadR type nicotinamide-nucleotide adenylyltransferase
METITRGSGATRGNPIRVVLTGSESTGKTVLAGQLAAHYGAELAPEFVRDFAVRKGSVIDLLDVEQIARGQIALEDRHAERAAALATNLLIQDTDLLSTVVYCNHYYGECADWITKAASDRRPDLYLLLDIDVPWIPDDVRDRGTRREEMQQLFRTAVAASGAPYTVIRGSWDERMRLAQGAVDALRT